jgi:choline dehydrogenase-like flavoprotein
MSACTADQLQHQKQQIAFDVIIVGAGASAAGMLHGLLTRSLENDDLRRDEDDIKVNGGKIRIAVIERGAAHHNNASVLLDDDDDDTKSNEGAKEFAQDCTRRNDRSEEKRIMSNLATSNPQTTNEEEAAARIIQSHRNNRFDHPHPSTYSLRHWFTAAHFISRPMDRNGVHCGATSRMALTSAPIFDSLPPSPTLLHITTPQRCLNNRIIDVPTGTGWGGTTNINAGLIVEPCYGYGKALNDNGKRVCTSGDFDAWPGQWKGGKSINDAMHEILEAMRENGSVIPSTDGNLPPESKSSSNNNNAFHWMVKECFSGEHGRFQHVVTSSTTMPGWCKSERIVTMDEKEEEGLGHIGSKRVNYFSSLIEPLVQKYPELESCVTFLSGLQAERIMVDIVHGTPRARGVEVTAATTGSSDGRRFIIQSRQDIIVCAGAIGSPSLLLASGIGRADDLMAAGIAPWYELPSLVGIHRYSNNNCDVYRDLPVGHNLRDHVILPRILVTPARQEKSTLSNNSVRGSLYLDIPMEEEEEDGCATEAKIELQLVDGIQMDAMITHAAAAALRRDWSLSIGNMKWNAPLALITRAYDFVHFILNLIFSFRFVRVETRLRSASINVCLLSPKSTGKVHMRKKDGYKDSLSSQTRLSECEVLVDPGYLSNPLDVDALWMGWEASSMVKRRWFGDCRELLPGLLFIAVYYLISSVRNFFVIFLSWFSNDNCTKKKNRPVWFESYVAEFTNPYYHWCGTCAMGEESMDAEQSAFVVDEQLCVRGITGLRVCDASVFPGCISAPTALTCAALGRAASAFVLGDQ